MSTVTNRPKHSPLGASGAERWLNCPGSVALLQHLQLPETDEPDYRKNGVAAHEAAAYLLSHSGVDAWEIIGEKFNDVEIDAEIAEAIQVYADTVRPLIARAMPGTQVMIEYPISSPVHPQFYGTLDNAVIVADPLEGGGELITLESTDYKHGEGILVEAENNPQLKYYAFGVLQDHPEIERVRLRIVQPRITWTNDGGVRVWETSADSINEWVEAELVPAMNRTEYDKDLDAGPWCRFCPAKLVCPLMTSLFGAAAKCNPAHIVNLNDESLARSYQYTQAVKFYLKALEDESFRRLNSGHEIAGLKLVHKKANRVHKPEAEAEYKKTLGDDIYTKPELKSPAEIEKLGATAKALVKEWAYTPQAGLTVALLDDNRPAVKVQSTTEAFGSTVAKLTADDLKPTDDNPDGIGIPKFLARSA